MRRSLQGAILPIKKNPLPLPIYLRLYTSPNPPNPSPCNSVRLGFWNDEKRQKPNIYIFCQFYYCKSFFSLSINNYIFSYVFFFIYVQMHCITFHSLLAQGLCVRSYFLCSCEFFVLGKYFVIYIFFFSSVFVLSEISC